MFPDQTRAASAVTMAIMLIVLGLALIVDANARHNQFCRFNPDADSCTRSLRDDTSLDFLQ